jgi:hypothetical protein
MPVQSTVASEPAPYELWTRHACDAALQAFQSERMAAATILLGAGRRTRFVGSGIGFDIARFGAQALNESGHEASAEHAHDLASFPSGFAPDETVIGIDTGTPQVGAALRRARATGLRTIALTDRELTLVEADVLLPHPGLSVDCPLSASPLAACFVLALLSARLEPGSGIAREVALLPAMLSHLTSTRVTAALVAEDLRTPGRRLILAGAGPSRWVAGSIARRINALPVSGHAIPALDMHLGDLRSPEWSLRPHDAFVRIEPHGINGGPVSDRFGGRQTAAPVWRIGGAPGGAARHTRLPGESPALASICALYVLEQLLLELASA